MLESEYSPLKIFHHQDRIQRLKEGKHPVLLHAQIIPTNLCNHDCHFCLTEDTLVNTITGKKPISDVCIGDYVLDLDGGFSRVTNTSRRRVSTVFEISAGGETIRCSEEHPILTNDGFKKASEVQVGDTTIMCMRVWETSERTIQEDMALVSNLSSTEIWSKAGGAEEVERANAFGQESNEKCGNSEENGGVQKRNFIESISRRNCEYIQSSSKTDVDKESYVDRGIIQKIQSEQKNRHGSHYGRMVQRTSDSVCGKWRWILQKIADMSGFCSNRSRQSNRSGNREKQRKSLLQKENKEICNSRYRMSSNIDGSFDGSQKRYFKTGETFCGGGWKWSLEKRRVDKVQRIDGSVPVFNFSCSPSETYVANGFAVHNCAYRLHGYSSSEDFVEQDRIPWNKLQEIVQDCAKVGVRAIEITGGGEPTIYRQFVDLCGLISELGMDYAVVTNGAVLNKEKIEALSNAKWVRFSIDASNEHTYAKVRDISKQQFFKTRYNIRDLVKLRDSKSESDLVIGVGFVVTKENYKEVVDACRNAREDGADNFRISAFFQNDGADYFKDFYQEARELCYQAQHMAGSEFKVFNLFGDRIGDLEQQFPDYQFCGYQHFVTYIGADLNVYRCCNTAYNPRGFLGSLADQSFYHLWMNVQDKLEDFDARRCPRCMFNTKNRRIAYAIDSQPKHVNFL